MISTYIPTGVGILGGFIGVSGWLSGGYRQSVAKARTSDIAALEHRVKTLEAERAALEAKVSAQSITIDTLLDRVRGSDLLAQLVRESAEQHKALLDAIKGLKQCP